MIEPKEINKAAYKHLAYCVVVVSILNFISIVLAQHGNTAIYYASNSAWVFSLIEIIAVVLLWKWVVLKHFDYITTFHTAISGMRMLLVLVMLGIIYAFVGRAAMLPYVIVFGVFYFVLLVMHSIFFARQTKVIYDNNK